jgi:hemoglobin/transferrin/lactoferrin receptor protein
MGAYTLQLDEAGWFNGGLRTTISYQDIEESRHNRNFNAPNRTSRIETVGVWGFLAEGTRHWGNQTLSIGLDGQHNDVQSKAFRTNVNTGATTTQSTRYPDGGSTMYNVAAYATHQWQKGEKWVFSEGLRVGYTALEATFVSREFYRFPFDKATQSTPVISGSLGAVWNANSKLRFAANAASGFRVPNVDDLGKVFDSAPGNVIVPNPDLKPEKTFNLELNVQYRLSDRLRWENVVWGTAFVDAIVAAPFKFNGQDSILYNDKKSLVIANQNNRRARLYGFTSELEADVCSFWAVYGSVSYTKGEILGDETIAQPLDHIPPVYGRFGTRLHNSRAFVETYILFNGKKPISEYNKGGEDNPQYATADGMPSWWTLNLRTGLRFWKNYQLQIGVDNLFDVQYRTFASGINGPGRNIYATARFGF